MTAPPPSPAPDSTARGASPPPAPRTAWQRLVRRWQDSLRLRLLAVSVAPLLLAFPFIVAVIVGAGQWLFHTQIRTALTSNLAGSDNYLQQLRVNTLGQLSNLARSERLSRALDEGASAGSLSALLRGAAQEQGLDFLLLARADGRIIARSDTGPIAGRIPDIPVVQQARLGMSEASFERLALPALAALSAEVTGRLPTPARADALVLTAAVHLPLTVRTPETLLVGGLLLEGNHSLVERMREIIYPVDVLPDPVQGVIELYLGDEVVARTRTLGEATPAGAHQGLGPVAQTVLGQGQPWFGRLDSDLEAHQMGFGPIVDGTGERIGMVAVGLPEGPYRRATLLTVVAVGAVLALTMLALTLVLLRTGSRLSNRLSALNHTMNAVRAGRTDARAGLPAQNDEIGRLQRDLDGLLDSLGERDAALTAQNASLQALTQTLEAERQRMSQVIDGTRAGTWAWNVQTGETRFNERWAEIIGYTLAELEPIDIQTWLRFCHPDDLPRSEAALNRHFRREVPFYDIEVRMRHRDGRWVWVHDRGTVLEWTEDSQPLWMFGTHMDVTERVRAQTENAELLGRLQRLTRNMPGMLYQYRVRPDGTSHVPYTSDGILDVYGCTPAEVREDATPIFDVLHPDDLPRIAQSIQVSARTLQPWHEVYRVRHPVRGERWVEGNATPEYHEDGSVTWHGYIRDITAQHTANLQIRLASRVFEASQEGIMITDARQIILDVNPAYTEITGFSRDESIGHTPSLLRSGHHPPDFYQTMRTALQRDGRWKGEVLNRRKTGELFAEMLSISALRDERGETSHYVAILTDISQIKAQQDELDRIANYDVLTGIPNRRLLNDRLTQALAQARRSDGTLAVCMMDLDGFKPVNDTHGHEAGDRLLVEIARRLSEVLRADETVARLGGDEFVLLMRDAGDGHEVFARVLDTVRQPVTLGPITVQVTASLGVVYDHGGRGDPAALLREADAALYESKARGRDCYTVRQFVAPADTASTATP